MNRTCRILHRSFVTALRAYRGAFLDLRVWGRDRIPPGSKIFITNHITSTDPYWVLPEFPEPVHVIIGPGYHSKPGRWILDRFEQINAMPDHRRFVVERSVEYLSRGESVYTAPEGDLQETFALGRFFPGVGKIYRRSRAPIIPIALLCPRSVMREYPRWAMTVEGRIYRTVLVMRGLYCINIGEPFKPPVDEHLDDDQDARRIAELVRERVGQLVSQIRDEYLPHVQWT